MAHRRLMDAYGGLASLYAEKKEKAHEAIKLYLRCIEIIKQTGNIWSLVSSLGSLGDAYKLAGDYAKAFETYNVALSTFMQSNPNFQQSDAAELLSWLNCHIGKCYEHESKLDKALQSLLKTLPYVSRISQGLRGEIYDDLSTVYRRMNNYKLAYEYNVKAVEARDSAAKQVNLSELNKVQMQYEFKRIQDSTRSEQMTKDLAVESELQKQKRVRNGFIAGFAVVLVFAGIFFQQRNRIRSQKELVEREKQRSEELLLNILPSEVAHELKEKGKADAKQFENVSVLFTDFKAFTTMSERLSPEQLVTELHSCFKVFDEIIGKYHLEKIKTIGDAYLAVCGLPLAHEDHAKKVVMAALEIRDFMLQRRRELGENTFEVRIGINSGSVVAGIVGVKKFAYDIWGDTVNTAARMEQHSKVGKVNISQSTYDLIHSSFNCQYRGEIDAKNKGMLKMYFVERA